MKLLTSRSKWRVRSLPPTKRDCPSRHQAGEHHAPAGRIRESARLWDCKACRTGSRRQRCRRDEALLLVETNLGSILGTVPYMSPEQACGAQVDKGTDIWSLGVVLYEMVTGHAPFIGDTPREVMSSILEKEPPPLTNYIRQAPAELQQIISKTLRKDREERYQSAQRTASGAQRSTSQIGS